MTDTSKIHRAMGPTPSLRRLMVEEGFGQVLVWQQKNIAQTENPAAECKSMSDLERQANQSEREDDKGFGRVYAKAPKDAESKATVSNVGKALIADKAAGSDLFLRAVRAALRDPESVVLAEKIAELGPMRRKVALMIIGRLTSPHI